MISSRKQIKGHHVQKYDCEQYITGICPALCSRLFKIEPHPHLHDHIVFKLLFYVYIFLPFRSICNFRVFFVFFWRLSNS